MAEAYVQNWKSELSCFYRIPQRFPGNDYRLILRDNIAAFDLHGTLIESNRGLPLSVAVDDWIWTGQLVPSFLNQLPSYNWNVAIFSNHVGLGSIDVAIGRVEKLLESLDYDPFIFIAVSDAPMAKKLPYFADNLATNPMIKPNTGMWSLYFNLAGLTPDLLKNKIREGFYCGDLGGDHGSWAFYQRKDTDYMFTYNINQVLSSQGIIIIGKPDQGSSDISFQGFKYFDPSQLLPIVVYLSFPPSPKPCLVIMVGQQGSGKSTMANWIITHYPNFVLLTSENNRKYLDHVQQALQTGRSVVFDATNPTILKRSQLINVANHLGVPSYILWSARPGYYLNKLRGDQKIPDIALRKYSSSFERPTPSEGATIIQIS